MVTVRTGFVFKKLSIAVALALVSVDAAYAFPAEVVAVTPPALLQIQQTVSTGVGIPVATAVDTQGVLIVQAIGDAANGLKTIILQSQNQLAQQLQSQANAQMQLQNQQKALSAAPDACASISSAAYATAVSANRSWQASVNSYAGKVKAGTAPPAGAQIINTLNNDYNNYCDPSTTPDACASAAKPQTNGSKKPESMVGADKSSGTLFNGAGDPGHVANLTFTPNQVTAANDYIQNTIDSGDAPRKLSKEEFQTLQGQQYEGLRIAYEARISMARDALANIESERQPVAGSALIVQNMKTSDGGFSTANYVNGKFNDPKNGIALYSQNGDVSPMQLLDLEVGRRVDNPDWYTQVNTTTSVESLTREQVFMTALILKMEYMRLKDSEYMLGMTAQNTAALVKQQMLPQIRAADAAVAQGVAGNR